LLHDWIVGDGHGVQRWILQRHGHLWRLQSWQQALHRYGTGDVFRRRHLEQPNDDVPRRDACVRSDNVCVRAAAVVHRLERNLRPESK
jgi:hypothetical protein